jgi:hypothetical protein
MKAVGNVKEQGVREIEIGRSVFVDPDNKVIGMLLYDGHIKVGVGVRHSLLLGQSLITNRSFQSRVWHSRKLLICL